MAKIIRHRLKSLPQLQQGANHPLLFRGNSRASHGLIPTLYRHPSIRSIDELRKLERQLMTRFRQRSIPYRSRDLIDDWEALFFMQHYGVPTRLLDWTENPSIALHFALVHGWTLSRGGSSSED